MKGRRLKVDERPAAEILFELLAPRALPKASEDDHSEWVM